MSLWPEFSCCGGLQATGHKWDCAITNLEIACQGNKSICEVNVDDLRKILQEIYSLKKEVQSLKTMKSEESMLKSQIDKSQDDVEGLKIAERLRLELEKKNV